jgi:hypothetical protein
MMNMYYNFMQFVIHMTAKNYGIQVHISKMILTIYAVLVWINPKLLQLFSL